MTIQELKKKYRGVVYKRRASMPLAEAMVYAGKEAEVMQYSQILQEINWFLQNHPVSPKVLLAYERRAFFGKEDANLRATFDSNIRWREDDLDLTKGSDGYLLAPGMRVMEIKVPGAMPLWLTHLLDELSIYPSSFSKYGTCYQRNLSNRVGGDLCA